MNTTTGKLKHFYEEPVQPIDNSFNPQLHPFLKEI